MINKIIEYNNKEKDRDFLFRIANSIEIHLNFVGFENLFTIQILIMANSIQLKVWLLLSVIESV